MYRLVLTTTTFVCLAGLFRLYAAWVTPLALVRSLPALPAADASVPVQPPDLLRVAEHVLEGSDWTVHANYKWQRSKEAFVYFNERERIEDGQRNKLRLKPFALVWFNPAQPQDPPYSITCTAARVHFESPVELSIEGADPGRIKAAALEGRVEIRGPRGLHVVGADFVFSEEDLQLYSDRPVQFAFGPQPGEIGQLKDGYADGAYVELLPADEAVLGKDLPHIAGIRRVTLRRNVRLDVISDDHGRPMPARITSAGRFELDVERQSGTFYDDVEASRPTGVSGETDRLQCQQLQLAFEAQDAAALTGTWDSLRAIARPAHEAATTAPATIAGLRFRSLVARGDRVALTSDANQLVCRMHELHYDALQRSLALRDDLRVVVRYDASTLQAPQITLVHDAEGQVHSAECVGPGWLTHVDPARAGVQLRASWQEHLRVRPEVDTGLTTIELQGAAQAIQPGRSGILADRLTIWVDGTGAPGGHGLQGVIPVSAERSTSGSTAADAAPLADASLGTRATSTPLRHVLAKGHVALAGPEFQVETDHLEARLSVARLASAEPGGLRHAAGTEPGTATVDKAPWIVNALRIDADIIQDPDSGDLDIAAVSGEGDVEVSHNAAPDARAAAGDPPLRVSGTRISISNSGGDRQRLQLKGGPAHLWTPEVHIQGSLLEFDREQNLAGVVGTGLLQFPVSRDADGHALPHPAVMDITWRERMTFDGSAAKFVAAVHAALNDSHLHCEELTVTLNRRVLFSEPQAETRGIDMRQIHCRDAVRVEFLQFDGTDLVGIRKLQLAEFTYRQDTGEFHGLGPGRIDDWQRGRNRRVAITPKSVARANAPAAGDGLPWEFSNVRFSGRITGNTQERQALLQDRVGILYAPVERALDTFDRDELSSDSKSAAGAVWLGCDELRISLHHSADRPQEFVNVLALGNGELEGQAFRAVAHEISFDESKDLFRLRGRGHNRATIYVYDRPGSQPSSGSGQIIDFVPSRRQLTLDGSTGIWGSR